MTATQDVVCVNAAKEAEKYNVSFTSLWCLWCYDLDVMLKKIVDFFLTLWCLWCYDLEVMFKIVDFFFLFNVMRNKNVFTSISVFIVSVDDFISLFLSDRPPQRLARDKGFFRPGFKLGNLIFQSRIRILISLKCFISNSLFVLFMSIFFCN